jgi:hypothetical protein
MKKMTEDLFTFPIVMVDGENEERKEKQQNLYGADDSPEYDIVYGEAAYPYYDFVGFEDRWLPTQLSLKKALKQKFEACIVRFANIGQFLVPMNKQKFREAIEQFAEEREKQPEEEQPKGNVTIIKFTPEMLAQLATNKTIGDEKQGE